MPSPTLPPPHPPLSQPPPPPQLIKSLEQAHGNGTSMISLILPPKADINKANQMLTLEMGTASNIKSRVNRQSVLAAIGAAQVRLKNYPRCPDNGLVVYTGMVVNAEGKERRLNVDFEPFRPINTSLYLCDNKFHTEALQGLLQSDNTYGFVVMDGLGCLWGTLQGNNREVLHRLSVDLPKKHGRGGQSAQRFGRIRMEKRHNYLRKVAETTQQLFIDTATSRPSVAGLVLAGSAEFKNDLVTSDLFDVRLKPLVVAVVDVSYGGDNGFNQAVELASESLANVKFVQERKLINAFFEQIRRGQVAGFLTSASLWFSPSVSLPPSLSFRLYLIPPHPPAPHLHPLISPLQHRHGQVCVRRQGHACGVGDGRLRDSHRVGGSPRAQVRVERQPGGGSRQAHDGGAGGQGRGRGRRRVSLPLSVRSCVYPSPPPHPSLYLLPVFHPLHHLQAKDGSHFASKDDGSAMEALDEPVPLTEWFASNFRRFGCRLEFVTNKSENGSQFCKGFGGVGGILRYQVNLAQLEDDGGGGGGGGGGAEFASDAESDGSSGKWDSDEDFM